MPEHYPAVPALPLLGGDRPLPHNLEAERAVLGCLLLDPEMALEPVRTVLRDSASFHDPRHQRIYSAILGLCREATTPAIDILTVTHALEKSEELESAGGQTYIAEVGGVVVTAANVEHYVEIVHQNAVLRRLIETSCDVVQKCYEPQQSVRALVDEIESEILKITESHAAGRGIVPVGEVVMDAIEHIDKLRKNDPDITGISTGYDSLDHVIMGLRPTEMIVLAARPSIGKTALALNIAENIALGSRRVPVGIFSLEMGTKQLVLRFISSLARINMGDIRHCAMPRSRWDDIANAGHRLKEAPLYIDDSASGLDVIEIRSRARRMKAEHDIGVLFIDYLQLIRPTGGNRSTTRENEVAAISGGIKGLARELDIPIVVLAQLNRQAEQAGGRPKLSHLRESGAIEQDADIVMLLHRERDVGNTSLDVQGAQDAEVIVAKHRNGQTGTAELLFIPAFTRFEKKSPVPDEDVPI